MPLVAKIAFTDGTVHIMSVGPGMANDGETESQTVSRIAHANYPNAASVIVIDAASSDAALPPTIDKLKDYVWQKVASIIAAGQTFNLGSGATDVLSDGTTNTIAHLLALSNWGQANPTATKEWIDNNNVATVLTGAQLGQLYTDVNDWVLNLYPAAGAVIAAITASPPTITTFAQVDGYAWPTS